MKKKTVLLLAIAVAAGFLFFAKKKVEGAVNTTVTPV
jgi:HAMP domain-containing protein